MAAKVSAKQVRKDIVRAYLEDHPCCQCGMADIRVLDFHHRVPEQKTMGVSQMLVFNVSVGVLLEEIEKCDVLCSNCHRILHAEERGDFYARRD